MRPLFPMQRQCQRSPGNACGITTNLLVLPVEHADDVNEDRRDTALEHS